MEQEVVLKAEELVRKAFVVVDVRAQEPSKPLGQVFDVRVEKTEKGDVICIWLTAGYVLTIGTPEALRAKGLPALPGEDC